MFIVDQSFLSLSAQGNHWFAFFLYEFSFFGYLI